MSFLKSLFSSGAAGLVCPRCEKSLEGHDEAACSRRMSRRFFFQVAAGGAVAIAVAEPLLESGIAIARKSSNRFLTVEEITREALLLLRHNMVLTQRIGFNQEYEKLFLSAERKIGDTISVRRPRAFAQGVA